MRSIQAQSSFQPKRVLLDMSHTHNSPHKTGIQRVVRNLYQELPAICKSRGLKFQAVVWRDGNFVALESLQQSERASSWREVEKIQKNVLLHMPAVYTRAAEKLCQLTGSKKLRKWLLPQPGHQGLFKLPLKAMQKWRGSPPAIDSHAIMTNENDLLILPDGYWVMMYVWDAIAAARQRVRGRQSLSTT